MPTNYSYFRSRPRGQKKLAFDFCDDIISNILIWIPAMILHGRLRCVCKQWLHIIRDPLFVRAHLAKSKSKPSLYCIAQSDSKPYNNTLYLFIDEDDALDVRPLTVRPKVTILASCNGLILLTNTPCGRSVTIANPITQKYLELPYFSRESPSKTGGGIVFDIQSKVYKVVVFYNYRLCQPLQYCKILTLKSGEMAWKSIDCPFDRFEWSKPPVVANGALYWYHYDRKHLVSMEIVSGDAKFRRIELPVDMSTGHQQLMNVGDRLSVSINHELLYHMWLLNDKPDEQLWSKKQTIGVDYKDRDASIIGSLRDGKVTIFKIGGTTDCMAIDHVHNKEKRFSMMDGESIISSTITHVNSLTSWGDYDTSSSHVEKHESSSIGSIPLRKSWTDNYSSVFDHVASKARSKRRRLHENVIMRNL